MILRIEFIDTETTTMYTKLLCERHRYIFYGILELEVTFNIISILLLYMDVCLFVLILYVPSTIFQLYRDGSSWVEPVLS